MSFFAMPAWQPPSGYRIPAWLRPPETMVPGIVPVELVVARTDTQAVLVTDLGAYPTGLAFTLTGRPRPDRSGPPRCDPVRDRRHRLPHRNLWLELRFADGRTVSTDPRSWPRTFETEQPNPPFLYYHGGRRERALAVPSLAVGSAATRAAGIRVAGRPGPGRRSGDRRQAGARGGRSSHHRLAHELRSSGSRRTRQADRPIQAVSLLSESRAYGPQHAGVSSGAVDSATSTPV